MDHDFRKGNSCGKCGQNVYGAEEECPGNKDAYEDYIYELSQDC